LTAAAVRRIIPGEVSAEPSFGLHAALANLGTDLSTALEHVSIPAYVFAADGRVLWTNEQMAAIVGDARGRSLLEFVAPESRGKVEEQIAAKRISGKPTHYEISLLDRDRRRIPVEVNSVPLESGHTFVGVFGLVTPPGALVPKPPPSREPHLTQRQHEVLLLLGRGASTQQIADTLGLRPETVRNHIRGVLKRLGQSSRVAAIAYARQHGLL
jgi:PAS domain S-box-containing protein